MFSKQKIMQFIKEHDREKFILDQLPKYISHLDFTFDIYSAMYLFFSTKYNFQLECPTFDLHESSLFKTKVKYPLRQIIRYANDEIRLHTNTGGFCILLIRKSILNYSDLLKFETELREQVSYKDSKYNV